MGAYGARSLRLVVVAAALASMAACSSTASGFGSTADAPDVTVPPDARDVPPGPADTNTFDAPPPTDGVGDETRPEDVVATDAPSAANDAPNPADAPPLDEASPLDTAVDALLSPDVPGPLCAGNGDEKITADELPFDPTIDVRIAYTVNRPGTIVPVADVEGVWQDGVLVWDFLAYDSETDMVVEDALVSLEGAWFAEAFPSADYASALDASGELLGVYRHDPASGAVALEGLASVTPGETLLVYETPVVLFRFPIEKGDAYASVDVEATGTSGGFDYPLGTVRLEHDYRFTVDRRGLVRAPAGDFAVLRIAADIEMRAENLGVPVSTTRSRVYFFMSECIGLVARVRSVENELDPAFDEASEVRRIGFPL